MGWRKALVDNETARRRFYDALWPHMPSVLRTAHLLCGGDASEAEELAQETMLKAFRAIGQYRDGTDARAWLLTILRHARIDRVRAAAAAPASVSLDALDHDPAAAPQEDELDADAAAEDPQALLEQFSDAEVIRALAALPEEIRWTLLLVDVQGMDHARAAEVLRVPVGTIKSRAHRGRRMLRGALLPRARPARLVRDNP